MSRPKIKSKNDVKEGSCFKSTPVSSGRESYVPQVTPDRHQATARKMKDKLNIATWNIRTLLQKGKLENIKQEMERMKLNILGLSEVRRKEAGKITSGGHEIIYSGGTESEKGVGIIVDQTGTKAIKGYWALSDRVLLVKIAGKPVDLNIIQVYAPTANSNDEDLDKFYNELDTAKTQCKSQDLLTIMGDFNAKVGTEKVDDIIGKHGLGIRNERDPVTIKVNVSKFAGFFEICNSDDELVCTGKITDLSKTTSAATNTVAASSDSFSPDNHNSILTGSHVLKKEDFYRIWTPSGYKMTEKYHGVAKAAADFSEFSLEWNGDWCCFLNTMLQAALCAFAPTERQIDTRCKLAGVGSLLINPLAMQKHSQDKSDNNICFRAQVKRLEKKIVCPSLMLQNIQLRHEILSSIYTEAALSVDKYSFIPYDMIGNHNDNSSQHSSDRLLHQYMELCITYAITRLQELIFHSKRSSSELSKFKETLSLLKTSQPSSTFKDLDKAFERQNDCILAQFLVKTFDSLSEQGTNNLSTVLPQFRESMMQDRLLGSLLQKGAFQPILDIILDNNASSERQSCKLNILEVNGSRSRIFSQLIPLLKFEPRLHNFIYNIADKNAKRFEGVTEHFSGINRVDWDIHVSCDSETISTSSSKKTDSASFKWNPHNVDENESQEIYNFIILRDILQTQESPTAALTRAMKRLSTDGFLVVSEVTDNFPLAHLVFTLFDQEGSENDESNEITTTNDASIQKHIHSNGGTKKSENSRQLRNFYPDDVWQKLFADAGLQLVHKISDGVMYCLYLLRRPTNILNSITFPQSEGLSCVVIDLDEESNNPDKTVFSFISRVKSAISHSETQSAENGQGQRIWLISRVAFENGKRARTFFGMGLIQLVRLLKGKQLGANVRCAIVNTFDDNVVLPDLSTPNTTEFKWLRENDLAINIYRDGKWGFTSSVPTKEEGKFAIVV
ncbi:craniofacial development protein 2-like protein [Plakobranchus ocellatus]|uniref:Craniofacial development protein 2-like protein n=1 Tax=Plakobranchus ocellatus TaxID=259542 RepID=A0AAV4DSK5_9GAST|nr:craniofacial development protein 2-like protein [Plakobranchus ocellatus]